MEENNLYFYEVCQKTLDHINSLNILSVTDIKSNDIPLNKKIQLAAAIDKMRTRGKSDERQINFQPNFLRLDYDDSVYELELLLEGVEFLKIGNCAEKSRIAFKHISQNYPDIRTEIFKIEGGDHVFVVLNRKKDSQETDPLTWGNAIIFDPHYNQFFPANEYVQKLKNFHYIIREDENNPEIKVEMEDFNKDSHTIVKETYNDQQYDDDFIKNINSENSINILKNYFHIKLLILEYLVEKLKNDLNEISKSSLLDEDLKLRLIDIEKILIKIKFLKENISLHTQNNYFLLKNNFAQELKILLNDINKILEPLAIGYTLSIDTKKRIFDLNYLNFFSKKNDKDFKQLNVTQAHINNPNDIILSINEIFDDMVNREQDKILLGNIEENKPLEEINIQKSIEETCSRSSRMRGIY